MIAGGWFMARKKAAEEVTIVLEEDEEEEENSEMGIKGGDVERYEVKIEPPIVGGRKMKVVRSQEDRMGSERDTVSSAGASKMQGTPGKGFTMQSSASSQQIYKIEDDLRRTRDVVEDLKHTVNMIEGDYKDIKAEMDRISYLLRSLEGLKNTMKDIESTVSELSGLYDMISANVNPFIDIEPMYSNGNGSQIGRKPDKVVRSKRIDDEQKTSEEHVFSDLSEIFDDDEEDEVLEEAEEWVGPDLLSEEWTLRWTQFLIDKVGKEGLERTLDYYLNLGWIDETMIDKVLEIARGTVGHKKKDPTKKSTWKMGAEDHVKSLEFIRRIKET